MAESRLQQEHPFPGDTVPKYRYMWIPATQNNSSTFAAGAGAGDPAIGEVASMTGIDFGATTDDHSWIVALPDDVDVNAPIDFRIVWSSDQTTVADTYTWTLKVGEWTLDSEVIAAPATALDTAIANDANNVTANVLQTTAWGTLDGGGFAGTLADGYLHGVLLDPATVDGSPSSDLLIVWALQIRYMPRKV